MEDIKEFAKNMERQIKIRRRINKKRFRNIIIILLFLIIIIGVYKSDTIMLDYPEQLLERIYEKSNIRLWPRYERKINSVFRLEDELNFLYFKNDLLDGKYEVYNLKLTSDELKHLNNVSDEGFKRGYISSEYNPWIKANLDHNNKAYNVKIKLHGDVFSHWNSRLKSYKIKSQKKEYIEQKRNFNLIIFENRFLSSKIARMIADDFGLYDIRDDIVVLKINGVVQGLYYLQEKLDSTFLENNECSNCVVVQISDNFLDDHPYYHDLYGIFLQGGHYTPFDYEVSNLDIDNDVFEHEVNYAIDRLFESVKENSDENNNGDYVDSENKIEEFFDIGQLSSFEAFRMVIGNSHMVTGDNLKMAYSQTNSKFYPIPLNRYVSKLRLNKGGLENHLSISNGYIIDMIKFWNTNDEFRHLKYKKVYDFVTDKSVIQEVDALVKDVTPYAKSYKTNAYSRRLVEKELNSHINVLNYNFNLIKQNLEYAKCYINIYSDGNSLVFEIIPDSVSFIRFDDIDIVLDDGSVYSGKISLSDGMINGGDVQKLINIDDDVNMVDVSELVNDKFFAAGLDENMNPSVRKYYLEFVFENVDKINIKYINIDMINDVSGARIDDTDVYYTIADKNDFYEKERDSDFGIVDGNEIKLVKGNYEIKENIIIPKDHVFVIDAGVKIKIDQGKSIISYSPVKIIGTETEPVVISASDPDKPFGVFGIVGSGKGGSVGDSVEDNADDVTEIHWLRLSGGSEKNINGIYFSGALSIYHSDVNMTNTKVFENHADDGMNIKYGDVYLEKNKFYDNPADQVDLDFCDGIVKNNVFSYAKGVGGGDGLDLSGSNILIMNNEFSGLQDKGLSIGEKTNAVVYNNLINDNSNGTAVKDLSNVYFINNKFKNNEIAINSYQKKQLFGGGNSYLYENVYENNNDKYQKDKLSEKHDIDIKEDEYFYILDLIETDDVNGLFIFFSDYENEESSREEIK